MSKILLGGWFRGGKRGEGEANGICRIALLYTLATAGASKDSTVFEQIPENLRESRTLILSPPGLVENWWDEFHKWIPQKDDDPNQLDLAATGQILKADSTVAMSERLRTINEWYTDGGVLLMGYATFRKKCLGR